MKKRWLLLICLFLTGCTVKYNVVIDKKMGVTENIQIGETDEFYKIYYKTSKTNALKNILDIYSEQLKENNYEFKISESDNPFVNVEKKYDNLTNFLDNSLFFNDYFDKINYNKDGNIIKIETEGFHPNEEENPGRFYVHKADIAIKCAFKVLNHNATEVDESTNTFHYVIDEDTEDFKILLEFDCSKIFNPYLKAMLLVSGAVLIIIVTWTVYIVNKKKQKKGK